jgi:hypothetical protein
MMSIKYRLYGGFGILVVMTLGLVIFGIQEFNAVAFSVTQMNGISENMTRAMQVESYLEKMRRSVLRYAYDHDEPSRKENAEVAKLAASTIQTAIDSTLADGRKEIYRGVQKDLVVADQTSQKLFDSVSQIDATQAKLFKASAALTASSTALIDKVQTSSDQSLLPLALRLDSQLNMMRVIGLRAQALMNVDSMPALTDAVAKIMATVNTIDAFASDDVLLLADPLKTAVADFHKGVQGVVASQREAHDLYVKEIAPQIQQIQAKVATLRDQVQLNFNHFAHGRLDRVPHCALGVEPDPGFDEGDAGACGGQFRRGAARAQAQGRGRQYRASRGSLQSQGGGERAARSRSQGRAGPAGRSRAAGRHG